MLHDCFISYDRDALKDKDLPDVVYYSIKSDGFNIPIRETRPKNFNPNKKYAVLMDVYGGPNSQAVLDQFGKYTVFIDVYGNPFLNLISYSRTALNPHLPATTGL